MMKVCEWCKTEFEAKKKSRRFCSDSHSFAAYRIKHIERLKQNNARYRTENAERIKQQRNDHAAKHPKKNLSKTCEWCKKEFEAKRKDRTLCSKKCIAAKYYSNNVDKVKERTKKWRTDNPEKAKQINALGRAQRYDSPDSNMSFLTCAKRARDYLDRLKKNPEKWSQHLAYQREQARLRLRRKKQQAARAAYFADPNNAARVEARNRMSPEQRAADDEKLDRLLEQRDRKARRDAIKKELAAAEATANIQQDPTWADIEWQ